MCVCVSEREREREREGGGQRIRVCVGGGVYRWVWLYEFRLKLLSFYRPTTPTLLGKGKNLLLSTLRDILDTNITSLAHYTLKNVCDRMPGGNHSPISTLLPHAQKEKKKEDKSYCTKCQP